MAAQTECGKQKTTRLESIGRRGKFRKDTVFNNIAYVVDLDLLRESYQELDGKKALGIDGVTKEIYGKKLEDNLQDLLAKIQRRAYKPQASKWLKYQRKTEALGL